MRSERMRERMAQRVEQETGRARDNIHEKADPLVVLIGATGLVCVMLFGWLIFRNVGLNPEHMVVSGKSVRNVRSGMSYDQVKDVAGLPERSEPPNAFEDPKPDAAVLYYLDMPGDATRYRVFMTGNSVSSLDSPPPEK